MLQVIDSYLISNPTEIWDNQELDDTDVETSDPLDAGGKKNLICLMKADNNTGTSHIKVEVLLSLDGTNFYAPETAADGQVIADFSGTTLVWKAFTLLACKKFKFVATGLGTNGSDIDFYLTFIGQA